MSAASKGTINPWWVTYPPLAALVLLGVVWGRDLAALLVVVVCIALVVAVVVAVHHAEVVALRVGEPFGTLILAVAVTVIEVALIVTLMVSGSDEKSATLARDTVFAALMITCNGVIGLCLLVGGLRHHVQEFHPEGAGGALSVLATLATASLVLPTFTESSSGPTFTGPQLAFAGVSSLVLYATFVFVQTVRHRDYFLPVGDTSAPSEHAEAPPGRTAMSSLGLLLVCLVVVVGLAKVVSPNIESGVRAMGAPVSSVGVVIALLVLSPETLAALRAARADRLQNSINLALGSAMASIGLTVPVIAVATIWLPGPLHLGLGGTEMVLLAITIVNSTLTLTTTGRATILQGAVHLAVFAGFLFLAVSP
jgi:Ca2+:H+ antiporter